jgi:hypothetical protein
MPFTFSHPALVLPLTYLPKKWFSLTGLIIGSLIPDFEYFLRMKIESNYSHTLLGLFLFDLPSGLLISFIFHNIIRNSLFDNLPIFLKSRVSTFTKFDWNKYFINNWFVVLISILIGAVSHLIWDSFTHNHGFFVETIPGLVNTIEIFGKQILILKILQHSSTIIGGLIIVFAFFKLPSNNEVIGRLNIKYWSILTGLTFLIIFIRFLTGLDLKLIGNLIVTCISAGFLAMTLTSILTNGIFLAEINGSRKDHNK